MDSNYQDIMSDPNTPPPMNDPAPEENAVSADSNPAPDTSPADPAPEAGAASAPPPAAPGSAGLGQGSLSEADEKTMSLLAHILGGVTCILGPLIIWLIKREESPFVNDQGKEALNFQITILIGFIASSALAMVPVVGCFSALLYPAIGIASLVFAILGGLEANKGNAYRYPFTFRFVN